MVNTNAIKHMMLDRNITGKQLAKELGITPTTFSANMRSGKFGSEQIEKMAEYFDIPLCERWPIFFADGLSDTIITRRKEA